MDVFAKPVWASSSIDDKNVQLSPRGPVAPEELVGADGRCGAPVAEAAPAPAAAPAPPPERPADRPVGSMAGDLASAPMPAATPVSAHPNASLPEQPPGAPQVMGGIALGMSECDVVRRAGLPGNVNIGAGDRGDRKVVLTYLTGTWPGIYTFDAGRLKDRRPRPRAADLRPSRRRKAKSQEAGEAENRRHHRPSGLRALSAGSGRLQRRAGGEPFLFRLRDRRHDLRAGLRQLGGARRIAARTRRRRRA